MVLTILPVFMVLKILPVFMVLELTNTAQTMRQTPIETGHELNQALRVGDQIIANATYSRTFLSDDNTKAGIKVRIKEDYQCLHYSFR